MKSNKRATIINLKYMENSTLNFEQVVLTRIDNLESKIDRILDVIRPLKSDNDLMTVGEVVEEYKISEWKLRKAREDPYHPLEYIIVGRNIKFRRSHIESYLSKREIKSYF